MSRDKMTPDDNVCLCFRVSLRKINTYLRREDPPVASLISECLGAGTGCGWCVPFLKKLHADHALGREPTLRLSPETYAEQRSSYRATGERDDRGLGLDEDN
ncbi:MAG: (2Fe-2S)-binding protein [Planctomycetota bacterium]